MNIVSIELIKHAEVDNAWHALFYTIDPKCRFITRTRKLQDLFDEVKSHVDLMKVEWKKSSEGYVATFINEEPPNCLWSLDNQPESC